MKQRLIVTGASGQLGSYVLRELSSDQHFQVFAWTGSTSKEVMGHAAQMVDLTEPAAVQTSFNSVCPDVVIHLAALCRVDACYQNPENAKKINIEGTRCIADLANHHKCRLVHISTDMVFDGLQGNYSENDLPGPVNTYGRTKLAAECAALDAARSVVVRISLLFGPMLNGRPSFFDQQLRAVLAGQSITVFHDEWRTPLSYPAAAKAIVTLAKNEASGCLHVGGPERMSRAEMSERLARWLGREPTMIEKRSRLENPSPETRPPDLSLDSSRFRTLFPNLSWPTFEDSLRACAVSTVVGTLRVP